MNQDGGLYGGILTKVVSRVKAVRSVIMDKVKILPYRMTKLGRLDVYFMAKQKI